MGKLELCIMKNDHASLLLPDTRAFVLGSREVSHHIAPRQAYELTEAPIGVQPSAIAVVVSQ